VYNLSDESKTELISRIPFCSDLVPPKGPVLNVTSISNAALNLQWKLWDSGGAMIKGYVLHFKAFDEWLERKISRYMNGYELKGLECGTRYQVWFDFLHLQGNETAIFSYPYLVRCFRCI
jgi:hypothetical protein